VSEARNALLEAALECERVGDQTRVEQLRNAFKELADSEFAVRGHIKALSEVAKGNYTPPVQSADGRPPQPVGYAGLLEVMAREAQDEPRAQKLKKDFLGKFEREVWEVNHAGQALPGEEEEDIVMEPTQIFTNRKCPYTGTPLAELSEPVQDDKGYVYEKSAVMRFIRQNKGRVQCPIPGTTHYVTEASLDECAHMLSGGNRRERQRGIVLD
jgi:hypothetical protein